MNQNELNFIKLEQGVRKMATAYKGIINENKALEEEIEALNLKINKLSSEVLTMKSDNEQLKVANALLGDENHRRLMKTRVNKLIKELDVCISQIKNEKG